MINVAIVEDEEEVVSQLKGYLERFSAENEIGFEIFAFNNAVVFLENYKPKYDIVLMDIEMPDMDGMTAAERLRRYDKNVTLIFVTNMVQYAVKGYEVGALSFIVKPVKYSPFSMHMLRAVRDVGARKDDYVTVNSKNGVCRISAAEIMYIEVSGHSLRLYTAKEAKEIYGSLSEMEAKLTKYHFLRCNVCYLVNPKHISLISGNTVVINDVSLQISRPRKKEFLRRLVDFFEKNEGTDQ